MKSEQDLHRVQIKGLIEDVRAIDRDGPRALDVVKAQVSGLDKKIDVLVDMVKVQNELLLKQVKGR